MVRFILLTGTKITFELYSLNSIMVRFILLVEPGDVIFHVYVSIPLWFDSYGSVIQIIAAILSGLNSIMVRFIHYSKTAIELHKYCLNSIMVRFIQRKKLEEEALEIGLNSIMVRFILVLFMILLSKGYLSLNSIMVRFILDLFYDIYYQIGKVSIPLWFDSYLYYSKKGSAVQIVSIPLWFDSYKTNEVEENNTQIVSIPLWFDSY